MTFSDLESSTKVILKVVFTILALAFLWIIRDIIVLLILSLILASAMDPMVDYFSQRRIPRAVSVLAVYVLVFGLGALVLYLFIPTALLQLQILADKWPEYLGQFQNKLGNASPGQSVLAEFVRNLLSGQVDLGLLSKTYGVFSGLFSLLTVLVISFYLVAEERGMKQFIATLLPAKHQEFTIYLIEKIQKKMGLWVIGQIILSFAIFLFTFLGLTILGVDYALFLALLAGFLEIIPYIGPFVSAVPAVFFAFIQSPGLGLAVAILYLIIQKTEGYVLVPKVMQKTVGTSPLAVLVALLVGFKLAGILGLLVAVPLVSAITVVVQEFSGQKQPELPGN
jgi:predicted PurR-regulated permease PerM